ncbi:MAG: 3-deoxy-D-manno-octulosonic acid transferase [Candidatus Adiutrix sp.]|jgi:3-deoxy-D-manno-octulosonic-acid transferase|nr:3-deoxy-D-manno-octulosonic acid transferase [Candidatus Adiutrix sp.]
MRLIYTIIYTLGFIITWPYWLLRDLAHHKPYSFKDRFLGPGRMLPKKRGRPRIWLWALSSGEILAAKKLVPALEATGAEVVITSTTAIGRDAALRVWPGRLVLASPLDFEISTRRFLDSVAPDLMVLVETDIWPGILWQMRDRGIPKALVSARISPKSLRGYGYIKFFWGPVLRLFNLITAQSADDRERLVNLGADPATTTATGDLKFDRETADPGKEERAAILREAGWPEGRWIVAGSTHAGEEAIIIDAWSEAKKKHGDLKLLIAPRNKSDFEAVWQFIKARELPAAHREAPAATDMDKDIFLLDTLGELDVFYKIAEIALVGKSWAAQHKGGGHNPLEPASKGKPVLFGPLTHNYRWMTKALLNAGGGLMVAGQAELAAALDDLLEHPEKARAMGQKAREFVRANQGATAHTLELLGPFLEKARQRESD